MRAPTDPIDPAEVYGGLTALEVATELAVEHDFWVFPLRPGTKNGHFASWAKLMSNDPDRIARVFAKAEQKTTDPAPLNVGIATKPSQLLVVDIDDKGGRDGSKTWANLVEGEADIWTRVHRTPTGGRHVFFRRVLDGFTVNNATDWAPGLDLRAGGGEHGGYVLLGAVYGRHLTGDLWEPDQLYPYTVEDDPGIAVTPGWLLELVRERDDDRSIPGADWGGPDIEGFGDRVMAFWSMGEGGRNSAFASICGSIRNAVASDETYALLAYAVARNAEHPLPADEVETTINSIGKRESRAKTEIKTIAIDATSWLTESRDAAIARYSAGGQHATASVFRRTEVDESTGEVQVEHAFYPGKTHIIYAPPGHGKSLLMMAATTDELVRGNSVVYLDHETDSSQLLSRAGAFGLVRFTSVAGEIFEPRVDMDIHTLADHLLDIYPKSGFGFGRERDRIVMPDTDSVLEQLLAQIDERLIKPPSLVIIDGVTNALALSDLEQNFASHISAFYVGVADRLAAATGAAVVLVDHTRKESGSDGPQGSFFKVAGISGASFRLERVPDQPGPQINGTGYLRLVVEKDRGGAIEDRAVELADGRRVWALATFEAHDGQTDMTLTPYRETIQDVRDRRTMTNPVGAKAERVCLRLVDLDAFSPETAVPISKIASGLSPTSPELTMLIDDDYVVVNRDGRTPTYYLASRKRIYRLVTADEVSEFLAARARAQ